MTSDSDDALSWDGDDGDSPTPTAPSPAERKSVAPADATLPEGWNAVGKGSGAVGRPVPEESDDADADADADADDTETPGLSTAMLLILGVVGGIYLLYSVGWVVGGLRLKPLANFFVIDAMFLPWFVLAVAAPLLWFLASWVLTRGKAGWIRVSALLLGVVLLVPWPFVTVGAIGL